MMFKRPVRLWLCFLLLLTFAIAASAQLPPMPALTLDTLWVRFGKCKSDVMDLQEYQAKLVSRIQQLELENAELKKQVPEVPATK